MKLALQNILPRVGKEEWTVLGTSEDFMFACLLSVYIYEVITTVNLDF